MVTTAMADVAMTVLMESANNGVGSDGLSTPELMLERRFWQTRLGMFQIKQTLFYIRPQTTAAAKLRVEEGRAGRGVAKRAVT